MVETFQPWSAHPTHARAGIAAAALGDLHEHLRDAAIRRTGRDALLAVAGAYRAGIDLPLEESCHRMAGDLVAGLGRGWGLGAPT